VARGLLRVKKKLGEKLANTGTEEELPSSFFKARENEHLGAF